jgi:DNA-binding NtrC family response regulator
MASGLSVGRPGDATRAPDKIAETAAILYLEATSRDRTGVRERLARGGPGVTTASDLNAALELLANRRFALCLVDLVDDRAALGAIRVVRGKYPQLPLAAIVDPANPLGAGEALDAGAVDLLPWPFDERDVLVMVANARDRAGVDAPGAFVPGVEPLFAQSAAMRSVVDLMHRAAGNRAGVLISGEPGTGRELIARSIHRSADESGETPFVVVDCADESPQELERRLFGVAADRRQGDVKPAVTDRVGRTSAVVQANGGTLLLLHLVDAPARVQGRLARLLRDREAMLAEKRALVEIDIRAVAIFDPAVEAAVVDGRVRRDLYERFVHHIEMPPLRRRREDIPALAAHFLRRACDSQGIAAKGFSRTALVLLSALPWHENARELQQLVGALVRGSRKTVVQLEDLLEHASLDGLAARIEPGLTLRESKARFERDCISAVLMRHHGRVAEAAKALGIQRTNLYRKVRQLNVARSLLTPRK